MRMVFLVVQWEGENSVSTISESKVVLTDQSAEEDLKEGMTVQVLVGKTSKGKSTLYQATVLKIFGKYHCHSVSGLKFLFLTILARGMIRGSSACFNASCSSI